MDISSCASEWREVVVVSRDQLFNMILIVTTIEPYLWINASLDLRTTKYNDSENLNVEKNIRLNEFEHEWPVD